MFGSFSDGALAQYEEQVRRRNRSKQDVQGTEFHDNNPHPDEKDDYSETYDFTTCIRKDGTLYGIASGKKCQKGTETATPTRSHLPGRVASLKRLAKGKLPKDQRKRQELYDAAHKRLGVLGNNPLNPKQQNDGHQDERQALSQLIRRLDDEFNMTRKVTEEQMRRAVGTVE